MGSYNIQRTNQAIFYYCWMDKKRTVNLGKENNCENGNKKDGESLSKIDRLLMIKRINHEDKDAREIRLLKNSKDLRGVSKSLQERPGKSELKPIADQPTNTQQYCQLYGEGVVSESEEGKAVLGAFLQGHDVDRQLRGRMLDWMIEVTSSYKFSAKTYFSSVYLMDQYFGAEEGRLPITKLHIIGVVSMLIATKMDEVYPLKVKTVFEKIVHKKIEKRELVEMEARMVGKLAFTLNVWSFYDLALLSLHLHTHIRNDDLLRHLELLCEYIGKFVVFNYELFGHYDTATLAEAVLKSAFRVYGVEKVRLAAGEKCPDFEMGKDCVVCADLILETIRTFKSGFKNLSNIYKFSDPTTIEKVDDYLRNH